MISQLRTATGEHHKSLEQKMLSSKIMDGSLNKEELNKLLMVNYLFFKILDEVKSGNPDIKNLMPNRIKDLEHDLKLNGELPKTTSVNPQLNLENESAILGMLYVALGSSLGGAMIGKKLEKNENLTDSSFTFYSESKTSIKQWKDYLAYIEAHPSINAKLCTAAAVRGFELFSEYYDEL